MIESLYKTQDQRGWIVEYYDDLNWMGLTLLDAYELIKDQKYLKKAIELYTNIHSAWDETCCGVNKGGIWWDTKHTQKATASNAGPVILAARLFKITKENKYFQFGKKVYDFWMRNMINNETFQVCDHMKPNGDKTWWKFTYNQGLMIGGKKFSSESQLGLNYIT